MIEIRYSNQEDVEIAASIEGLKHLHDAILALIGRDIPEIYFDADRTIRPEPWKSVGRGLNVICKEKKPARVSISKDGILTIEGSDENLEGFASFLLFAKEAANGSHSHFEFHEGNEYVAPDSIPLVISVR